METDERIKSAIKGTYVLRAPRQQLASFGSTNVRYYIITELTDQVNIVREGKVIAGRPKIVTPAYLVNVEGFSGSARRYVEMIAEQHPHEPGILYSYKNEFDNMNVISEALGTITDRINKDIEVSGNPLSAIIRGVEDMWDVSLMKFTFELTRNSVQRNLSDLYGLGKFNLDHRGTPKDAIDAIEELFEMAGRDPAYAPELASELRRWNLWDSYQDRFLGLFRGRN